MHDLIRSCTMLARSTACAGISSAAAAAAVLLSTLAAAQGGPGGTGEKVFNPNTGKPCAHAIIDLDEAWSPTTHQAILSYLTSRHARVRKTIAENVSQEKYELWWTRACNYFENVEQPWNFYEVTFPANVNAATELALLSNKYMGKGIEAIQDPGRFTTPQGGLPGNYTVPPTNPPTPPLTNYQDYLDPNLVHVGTAVGCTGSTQPGNRGTHNLYELNHPNYGYQPQGGVANPNPHRVYLIEADWIDTPVPHVDLDPTLIPLTQPAIPAQYTGWSFWSEATMPSHGSAVLGILNSRVPYPDPQQQWYYGTTGALPGLTVEFIPWWIAPSAGANGVTLIAEGVYTALADSNFQPRDTLLIEVQIDVNYCSTCSSQGTPLFAPVTYRRDVRTAIQLATSSGMHVIQPAGNTGVDLATFGTNIVDDGSIMVAAIDTATGCRSMWVNGTGSNYGARIDVCSAGNYVTTCGYGDLFPNVYTPNPQVNWHTYYTNGFSGTSSASAIMCALVASLVNRHDYGYFASGAAPLTEQPGWPLDPRTLRKALRYEPVGGAANTGLGVYPNAEQVMRRLSGRTFSRGQDTDCGANATNCAWPVLKTWKDCGAWTFSEPSTVTNSTFELWLDTCPANTLVWIYAYTGWNVNPLAPSVNGHWGDVMSAVTLVQGASIGSAATYCGGVVPVVDPGMLQVTTQPMPANVPPGVTFCLQAYVAGGTYSGVSQPLQLTLEP